MECIVRVRDKTNPDDPYLDAKLTKRGDVIAIVANGWAWGREELTNPEWRILKFPNISEAAAASFLQPEVNEDPAKPSLVLQKRGFKLNLEGIAMGAALQAWLADDTRAAPFRSFNITGPQLLVYLVKKSALVDPNVFEPV